MFELCCFLCKITISKCYETMTAGIKIIFFARSSMNLTLFVFHHAQTLTFRHISSGNYPRKKKNRRMKKVSSRNRHRLIGVKPIDVSMVVPCREPRQSSHLSTCIATMEYHLPSKDKSVLFASNKKAH